MSTIAVLKYTKPQHQRAPRRPHLRRPRVLERSPPLRAASSTIRSRVATTAGPSSQSSASPAPSSSSGTPRSTQPVRLINDIPPLPVADSLLQAPTCSSAFRYVFCLLVLVTLAHNAELLSVLRFWPLKIINRLGSLLWLSFYLNRMSAGYDSLSFLCFVLAVQESCVHPILYCSPVPLLWQ
jgi:hypothetical protein